MKIEDLYIGQSYAVSKSFTSEEVAAFSSLSMDDNPIHLNEDYASQSIFKSRIVHGFLTSSLFSAIIGTKLPGNGSIYLKQDLSFCKPIYHNETIKAEVTVLDVKREKSVVILSTKIYKENDEVAVDGTAVIKLMN